ncbi:MAG: NAD(P)H-binding protein [Saprospiraceae bacterium]|nr:NAD(P)H-binding protein [Saprospiraceae bacterium]
MKKALITGGTGVLGSALAKELQIQNLDFLAISRSRDKINHYNSTTEVSDLPWQCADLMTGEGLEQALIDVDTVFHLASIPKQTNEDHPELKLMENLLNAARKKDVQHLIYISILGVDRVPMPYYRAKLEAEKILQKSGIPYTILRATQFHEFLEAIINLCLKLPIGLVPKKFKVQPISLEAVVQALIKISENEPQHKILNIGGSEVLNFGEAAKLWLEYHHKSKPVINIPIMGKLMKSIANGGLLCQEVAPDSITWETYLQEKHLVKSPVIL